MQDCTETIVDTSIVVDDEDAPVRVNLGDVQKARFVVLAVEWSFANPLT